MKNIFTSFIFLFTASVAFSQTTIVLQPDSTGKDASLVSLYPSSNDGAEPELDAMAWTNQSSNANIRGLLSFDLSSIPANASIQSASLTLYFNPTSSNGSGHSHQSGSNASLLQRVTESWDESVVTWDSQPLTTTQNEVVLPQDTAPQQDYKANVTALVTDMINNPATSYGFMLKLQTEVKYRSMLFCSGDHPDASKHPKLEIIYLDLNGITNITSQNDFVITQNPCTDVLHIKIADEVTGNIFFQIYNVFGKELKGCAVNRNTNVKSIDIAELSAGIYLLHFQWGYHYGAQKFVKL